MTVEDLRVGDVVMTTDHRLRPIRWIAGRTLDDINFSLVPKLWPIRIAANALGANPPERDLRVSPQHRMLVRSFVVQRIFGADEILVAARQLTGLDSIEQIDMHSAYLYLLFAGHQIVPANGAATEPLYIRPEALKSLDNAAAEKIFTLFPKLCDRLVDRARSLATGVKARLMVQRYRRNGRMRVGAA